MRAWRRRWHLVSPTLYIIIIVCRVNLNKLSRNFVGALRTTTTNCRVSFIDLYLVFPRNVRIVFLPHTNIVILLKPYCGTITEPGLPVVSTSFFQFYSLTQLLLLKACFRYDRYDRCDRWGKKVQRPQRSYGNHFPAIENDHWDRWKVVSLWSL